MVEIEIPAQHCQIAEIPGRLGLFQAFTPKFVKKYGNVADEYRKVFAAYIKEVRSGLFPGEEHVYRMAEGEAEKLAAQWEK